MLLSVGYAACHWCHVMAHESFEDETTAALMNELFVSVKVDREERPDVDALYMDAVVALTGQGGWPMTVFLTPDGEPFFGGTYYPPEPRHGLPSFRQLLAAIAEAYRDRREDVDGAGRGRRRRPQAQRRPRPVEGAAERSGHRRGGARAPRAARPGMGRLRPRAEVPARVDDRAAPPRGSGRHGGDDARRHGCGRHVRPRRRRLPPLLRRRPLARPALREDAVRQRAARARIPARVARHRQRAVSRGGRADARLHRCASCALPNGGFASSQDADTNGVEGLTFTWTAEEGAPSGAARAVRARPLDPARRARPRDAGAAARDPRTAPSACARRQGDRLLERARARRPRGRRAAGSVAATSSTPRERSASSCSRVDPGVWRTLGATVVRGTRRISRTTRTSRTGSSSSTSRPASCAGCTRPAGSPLRAVELFADDERGGFFLAPVDGEQLVARRKDLDDNPTPSGNGMLAFVLLRLGAHLGRRRARTARRRECCVSCAMRFRVRPRRSAGCSVRSTSTCRTPRELAIAGPPDSDDRPGGAARVPTERRGGVRAGRGRTAARREGAGRRAGRPSTSASDSPAGRR